MKKFTFNFNMSKCRALLVAAFAGASMGVSAQGMQVIESVTGDDGITYRVVSKAISPNGKYIAGQAANYDAFKYGLFIYNVETGDFVFSQETGMMGSDLDAVSDNGVAVGYNGPGIALHADGTIVELPTPEGCESLPYDITDDETVIVGSYRSQMDYMPHACVWTDGVMTELPEPTKDVAGFKVAMSDARYVNSDGSLIAGFVAAADYVELFVLWSLQDDGTYVCEPVYKDYYCADGSDAERPYDRFTLTGMSRNGKYAAIGVTLPGVEDQRIARYDIENGTLEMLDAEGQTYEGGEIANDGTMICTLFEGSVFMPSMTTCLWRGSEAPTPLVEINEAFAQMADIDAEGSNVPTSITPDGRYISGFWYDNQGMSSSYVIDLGEVTTGITSVGNAAGDNTEVARYTLDGARVSAPVKGLNIVKRADGSVVKVMNK